MIGKEAMPRTRPPHPDDPYDNNTARSPVRLFLFLIFSISLTCENQTQYGNTILTNQSAAGLECWEANEEEDWDTG